MNPKHPNDMMSLSQYLIEEQLKLPYATGDFTALMSHLVYAAKIVSREVRKAGLLDYILGSTGDTNIQGETVMKLDEYADAIFTNAMKVCGHLCVMASEEQESIIKIPEGYTLGKYTFAYDPLDGSSNIDSNVSIGTIFSIHMRKSPAGTHGNENDLLQKGLDQRCAGYILYGSSTMMVFTMGHGVVGFTLDPSCGEFLLSHSNLQIPQTGSIYSINEGNYNFWSEKVRRFIDSMKSLENTNSPKTLRYIGSLVADFHRNLLKGGIFIYPEDIFSEKYPNGKLRLLYEVAPMAFIAEQAGGVAITVKGDRILDIVPKSLHERSTFVVGSKKEVESYMEFIKK